MFKYTTTYTDLNGTERTETAYFDLNQTEIIELEVDAEEGLAERLKRISDARDAKAMMRYFLTLIKKSYGEKSADGRRFVKSDEISTSFTHTKIYENLYIELLTNAEFAARFVNSVIPDLSSLANKINNNLEKNQEVINKIKSDESSVLKLT